MACSQTDEPDDQGGPLSTSIDAGPPPRRKTAATADAGSTSDEAAGTTVDTSAEDGEDAGAGPGPDAGPDVPAGSFAAGTELEVISSLNLRSGAGTEFDILGVMPTGTRVKVATASGANGWVNVDYQGTLGWASKEFLATP